jgi:hypothetical protein
MARRAQVGLHGHTAQMWPKLAWNHRQSAGSGNLSQPTDADRDGTSGSVTPQLSSRQAHAAAGISQLHQVPETCPPTCRPPPHLATCRFARRGTRPLYFWIARKVQRADTPTARANFIWSNSQMAILGVITLKHEFEIKFLGRCALCRLANRVCYLGRGHRRRINGLTSVRTTARCDSRS